MRSTLFLIGIWSILVVKHNQVFGQNKFSYSISAAPIYTYIRTNSTINLPEFVGNSSTLTFMDVNTDIRQTGQGYSVGLMARYEFSTHFSISTGIRLNHYKANEATITTNPDVTSSSNPQIIVEANKRRNYQIPLLINYQSSTKRLSPYFSAGVLINFPYVTIYDGGTFTRPNQKIELYPTLGAGILYRFNDHFSLIAQPTFSYILPSRTYISYQYYQLSLQTQLLSKF
ncbi:hypothetical protein BH09BAC4_BH09BAC4_09820 [soil metagenome]